MARPFRHDLEILPAFPQKAALISAIRNAIRELERLIKRKVQITTFSGPNYYKSFNIFEQEARRGFNEERLQGLIDGMLYRLESIKVDPSHMSQHFRAIRNAHRAFLMASISRKRMFGFEPDNDLLNSLLRQISDTKRSSSIIEMILIASRSKLDSLRIEGDYHRCFAVSFHMLDRIISAPALTSVKKEYISDLSAYILFPAAYGFFQSEEITSQRVVSERLRAIVRDYGNTSYSSFIFHTIDHQIISNISRFSISARHPFMRFDRCVDSALKACLAYDSTELPGLKTELPYEPGLKGNAALEYQSAGMDLTSTRHVLGKGSLSEQVYKDVSTSIHKGYFEGAARLAFGLAEGWSHGNGENDPNVKQGLKAWRLGNDAFASYPKIGSTFHAKKLLTAAQVDFMREKDVENASSQALQAEEIFLSHGALGRARHARALIDYWKKGAL